MINRPPNPAVCQLVQQFYCALVKWQEIVGSGMQGCAEQGDSLEMPMQQALSSDLCAPDQELTRLPTKCYVTDTPSAIDHYRNRRTVRFLVDFGLPRPQLITHSRLAA